MDDLPLFVTRDFSTPFGCISMLTPGIIRPYLFGCWAARLAQAQNFTWEDQMLFLAVACDAG